MGEQYAEVILDISIGKLDRPFSYRIPERLRGQIQPGMPVYVPFGSGNVRRKGYVIGLAQESSFDPSRIKEILEPAAKSASAEEWSLELAAFLRRTYGGTFAQALKVVLPAKAVVKQLEHRFLIAAADREVLQSALGEASRKHQSAKARLLEALLSQREMPYEWVSSKLGVSGQTVAGLERAGLVRTLSTTEYRNPVHVNAAEERRPVLTPAQRSIVDRILADADHGHWNYEEKYLLHGVTGSGKTEVYMALIEAVIAEGRQAIFLIPEIALTYQTLVRFYRRFGERVSVLNSSLSPGEKYDQCQRAKAGEIDVIIGPRSALFTPFPDVGIILMDEEHETSYKSESMPKYHTREVAEYMASRCRAALVLGSATPSVETYYRAEMGKYQLFTLKERATGSTLPKVYITDLRRELQEGNRSMFGRKLAELLKDRFARGEQSMLFLNRRGYAGFISCRSCGEAIRCPHCDVTLSLHGSGMLQCHYCGYSMPKPPVCPSCGSSYLGAFRAGTEQVESRLRELIPGIRTLRMDRDTTTTKDAYEKILSAFMNHEADVLIGTQMIVKGHDFPKVTLVGIIAADMALGGGDYAAAERTFQLLTQAAGRAGRADLPGEAVIQTYQPEHYAVTFAAAADYEGFYHREIAFREMMDYPPVSHLLAVQVFGPDQKKAAGYAQSLAEVLKAKGDIRVLGPAPGAISRLKDLYRFVIYVKARDAELLFAARESLEPLTGPNHAGREFVQYDFDPMTQL
ncbi:MAG: primosomal protein N' [Lachnospiraceae bacterium]|nr:primosomal protein N' [Lachnospiraceae bacterium]